MGPAAKTPHYQQGPGSISAQGTRSHVLQLRILHAVTKTWDSQISFFFFNKKTSITFAIINNIFFNKSSHTPQSIPSLWEPRLV